MPSIDVAMERSIRRGAMDLLAVALRPVVERRDAVTAVTGVPGQINDWKQSFSSWNNCMQVNYCKYPVIALIIVGGLIIFSVIWCIARCACCGLSCCCECFYCFKCCGNCCGCCDPPGGRKHKYLDDEPYAPPTQGYRSEAPMNAGPMGGFKPAAHHAVAPHPAMHHEPPQYAEFDVSKKGSEDALPEMPSWETAGSKKVLLDNEPMEMENLKKPEASGQNLPLMAGASPGPASPGTPENRSPYGPPPGAYGSNPYLPAGAAAGDPYGRNGRGYGPSQSSLAVDQGYGMAGAAAVAGGPMGPGRRSPRDYNGSAGGYGMPNQGYPGPQSRQGSVDDYRRPGGPGMQGGYDTGSYDTGSREPRLPDMMGGASPGYNDQPRRSPQPRGDYGYGAGAGNRGYGMAPYAPQRNYSSESQRPLAPRAPPQRQYSHNDPNASPSLQNNSGFDFNSGYSRPQTRGRDEYDYDRRPSGGNQGGGAYPGYKPYQPSDPRQQEGWSGL